LWTQASLRQQAKKFMEQAQQRQKAYANARRREEKFEVGDKVLLSTRNVRLKAMGTPKLMPLWIGPFNVQAKVGTVAYRLELPHSLKIHPVFHVSILKPYREDGRVQPPPPPLEVDDEGEIFEVEEVLKDRQRKGKRKEYLVRWAGYGPEHNTWEPEAHLNQSALGSYWDKKR
jgi:hypothetical protein